ncbi:hypothetical protein FRC06_006238, partial [Ceratobasidium sp. 370]
MPPAQDLQRFKKGVTKVKVWAGRESRDMMRQFLPVIIDAQAPPKFIQLVRALLDFSYIAHGAQLTEVKLGEMDKALAAFHKAKYVLQDMKIMVKASGFDRIPKLHMLGHWMRDIRELGTPDSYSPETPEHLHILYVKIPWWLSNHHNPMPQIVQYARRLEALEMQHVLLKEYYRELFRANLDDLYWEGEEDMAKREGKGKGKGEGEGEGKGEDGTKGDVDQDDIDGDKEDSDEGSDEDSDEDKERVE